MDHTLKGIHTLKKDYKSQMTSKLSQLRRINVGELPKGTQLNWASTISKSLTQEAKDAAQSMSTSLAQYKEAK